MEERYQRLADEVATHGGRLDLAAADLASRLGQRIDTRDVYIQQVVGRRLAAIGLRCDFQGGGRIILTSDRTTPATPAAPTGTQGSISETTVPRSASPSAQTQDAGPAPITTSPRPPGESTEPTAEQVGTGLYLLLIGVCSFFPAIGHSLAPGGKVGDKEEAFFRIYIATFPLSVTATLIFLSFFLDWFDSPKKRLGFGGAAIVVSAVWGVGFGQSYADLHTISQLHGPPLAVAVELAALALGAYAIYYGEALFIAGLLSAFFAALWIKEKVRPHQIGRAHV